MKKVLVCALAALFLMASCVNAFAATYSTTTSYVTDNDGTKLKVSTNVTDVAEGTMVTYLAYKGEEPNDETITYIDQQTADSNGVKFEYTTDEANLTGVTVKSGSDEADQTDKPYVEDESARVRTIKVVCGDDESKVCLPTEAGSNIVKSTIIATKKDYKVASATFKKDDETEGKDVKSLVDYTGETIKITDDTKLLGNGTLTITLEEPEKATVADDASGIYNGHSDGVPADKMTMFGKADGSVESDPTKEWSDKKVKGWGGIVVLETETEPANAEALVNDTNAKVYPAHFRGNDGSFAVQLVDKTQKMGETTMYACIYVVSPSGNVTYSKVHKFEPLRSSGDAIAGGIDNTVTAE